MRTGVIDEDLNRPCQEEMLERPRGRCAIDDVKTGHAGGTAARDYFFGHVPGGLGMTMGVHDDGIPIRSQPLADRGPDGSAAACHECTFLHRTVDCMKIAARPSMSAEPR